MIHDENSQAFENNFEEPKHPNNDGLLGQIQMFMNDEQKARLYHSIIAPKENVAKPEMAIERPVVPNAPIAPIARSAPISPAPELAEAIFEKPEPIQKPVADVLSANAINETANNQMSIGERRSSAQSASRSIGRVVCCTGSKVVISSNTDHENMLSDDSWSIGQMISISTLHGRVVCMITEMKTEIAHWREEDINAITILADILGEVNETNRGLAFKRGVTKFPPVGAMAHKIRFADLECIYDLGDKKSIDVGTLSQNENISAAVGVDDILGRHMAVMGTTGVGKSCAVGLLVSRAIDAEPNLRVVMLDPHNEFASAFGNKANNLDQNNLELPFWLLNFDELLDVVFRGEPVAGEAEILQELVVQAKHERQQQLALAGFSETYNGIIIVDTPVPYRMSDVLRGIDEILGQLEPKFNRSYLKSLRTRIEILENNPRYSFMFSRGGREENFGKIISNIFRLPSYGKPMTTINLAGLPGEVINCVAAVIARLCFDIARASQGAIKVLLVCEEAHRYVPKERELGFIPTRIAIARIAKEGRKYGCSVAIITQRPGELDPTILSQCSTVFAMRLTNEVDQAIIKAAISDSSGSIIGFMSSLDNREAIAFGEGVAVPMRLRFADHDLSKMRNETAKIDPNLRPINADDLSTDTLIHNIHGVQQQTLNVQPEVKPQPSIRNPLAEGPIRPGLTRPSLLKKDVIEILSRHQLNADNFGVNESSRQATNQPKPGAGVSGTQLRKDLW